MMVEAKDTCQSSMVADQSLTTQRPAMSIPPLTSEGLLPQGVYESALDEIAQHFGRFQGSDRRVVLFQALREYLEALTQTHLADHIIVDNSFVTAKDSLNDIDLLVMLRQNVSLSAEPTIQTLRVSRDLEAAGQKALSLRSLRCSPRVSVLQ